VADYNDLTNPPVARVEVSGRRYAATCRIAWDGVEYVGRLWFIDESGVDGGVPDRGAIPGRTPEEVQEFVSRLTPDDLVRRLKRAQAEKRRFHELRRATDEMLVKIRYLNQVAVAARAGLLDADGASAEMDLTEQQLHDMIGRLRALAGKEQ
jgi:hypothetical protein